MNRWWDSPALAAVALERVDDSDVTQGVGTAMLALHALAKSALLPLAERTLVDQADIADALGSLDVRPVAEALGRSVAGGMGPTAAAHYGAAWAEHALVDAGTGALAVVHQLRAAGLPMPQAIAAAADVAGVPRSEVGTYVEVAKDARLPELSRADAADRVLMTWASRTGNAEALEVEVTISKTAAFEEEHPRDDLGQFATKPDAPRRTARLERKARRKRREERHSADLARLEVPKKASLTELAGLTAAKRGSERMGAERVGAERRGAERMGKPRVGLAQVAAETKASAPAPRQALVEEPRLTTQDQFGLMRPVGGRVNAQAWTDDFHGMEEQIIWVPQDLAQEIIDTGGFTAKNLAHLLQQKHLGSHAIADWSGIADQPGGKMGNDVQLYGIRLSGRIPITHYQRQRWADNTKTALEIDDHAVFAVTSGNEPLSEVVPSVPEEELPPGADASGLLMRVINVHLVNDKDYAGRHFVEKAYEEWAHREVVRDELGEFAVAPAGRTPREVRLARKARRKRRNERMVRDQEQLAQVVSITELAALARAGQERRGAERMGAARMGQARVGTARSGEAVVGAPIAAGKRIAGGIAAVEETEQAAPEVEAGTDLARVSAMRLSLSQARALFPDDFNMVDDLVEGKNGVAMLAHPDPTNVYESRRDILSAKSLTTVMDEYANTGIRETPVQTRMTFEEALRLREDRQESFGLDNPLSPNVVMHIRPEDRGDPEGRIWSVRDVEFGADPEASGIILLGDKADMVAIKQGKPVELEKVAENNLDLAAALGGHPGSLGGKALPVIAMRVKRVHDENA